MRNWSNLQHEMTMIASRVARAKSKESECHYMMAMV